MRLSLKPPSPALVTQKAAARLPRLALWLLCAAYVLPGVFGRDPWRNADLTAFAYMQRMASGLTSWWHPTLGDLPAESALLPHWLGALAIRALPFLDAPLAARLPFALLLALSLALVWHATYHLARTEAAQPLPFAFGGEASPKDYARALADGAILAMIATLGLLQLGHETTPELFQLAAVSGATWALSAAPHRGRQAAAAMALALVMLAGGGAPTLALLIGATATVSCHQSRLASVRPVWTGMLGATLLAAAVATLMGTWQWRITANPQGDDWLGFVRQLVWFTWPTLPLAGWTLWVWRGHLSRRHISTPASLLAIALAVTLSTGGTDRGLMLCVPGLSALAAFALPTLRRQVTAAVDWFSVFFFTLSGATIWALFLSMQTGWPQHALRNIQRLAPEFTPSFSVLAVLAALPATLGWLWLVRWRTAHHRHALWKSLVLPAAGVCLCWLLSMTLLLPALDHARSPRPLVQRLQRWIPPQSCVLAPGMSQANVAALVLYGPYEVHALSGPVPRPAEPQTAARLQECRHLVVQARSGLATQTLNLQGWRLVAQVSRPAERTDRFQVYVRTSP